MGELAEAILDGLNCDCCGMPFLKEHGVPTTCTDCGGSGKLFTDATDEERRVAGWSDGKEQKETSDKGEHASAHALEPEVQSEEAKTKEKKRKGKAT